MAGVVGSTVSRIERGQTPDLETITAIAGALKLPVTALMRPMAAVPDLPPDAPVYRAFTEFAASEYGQTMSGAEATMLRSVRLPPGEEPTAEMYLMWLLSYRQSRSIVGAVSKRLPG